MSMAETASALAKSGAVTDRKLADNLIRTAGKVCVCVCVGGWVGGCVCECVCVGVWVSVGV